MSIQEAHAGVLADALSMLPGGLEGAPGTANGPATATFHPADPAIRLGPTVDLGGARGRPLSGAHVRIDAVRDGDAELLLYDLGGSRILPSIDYLPTHGVLDVHFVGVASADTYARLLSSLRYINRAPNPTPGERSIEISVLDAEGAETPVGRLDLTVVPEQPAPAAGDDMPDAQDGGASPETLVIWDASQGGGRADGILGWHRAGETPRGSVAGRAAAEVPAEQPDASATDAPSDVASDVPPDLPPDPPLRAAVDVQGAVAAPLSDDPSVFGDEALHLYGAAKLPLSWNGRGVAALSQPGGRGLLNGAADEDRPVDYLRDGTDAGAPVITGGAYRIFSAGPAGPAGSASPQGSADDASGGVVAEVEAAKAGTAPAAGWAGARPDDGTVTPWATPIDDPQIFQVLRPVDVFETDRAGGADPVAAPPLAAIPRLDAFLVGLPPSGDPLLPTDGEDMA